MTTRAHTHTHKRTCTRLYKELLCSFGRYTHAHTQTHSQAKPIVQQSQNHECKGRRRHILLALLLRSNNSLALLHVCGCVRLFVIVSVCG